MRSRRAALVWGVLFILLGCAFLLERLGAIDISGKLVVPALLIGFGVALLVGHDDRHGRPPFTHEHRPDDHDV